MTSPDVGTVREYLTAELGKEYALDLADAWSTEASWDSFRHLAGGIGDFNPLWWDAEYAAAGPRGGRTAPPIWLSTVAMPYQHVLRFRPPGWTTLDGDIRWEFVEHVRVGDVVRATARLVEVTPKSSRQLGDALLVRGEVEYRNQHDRVLARSIAGLWFFPARERTPGGGVSGPPTDASSVEVPYVALGQLTRRGPEPRYWEDVAAGDELAPLVRPTLSAFEILAWCVGSGMSGFEPVARGDRDDLHGLTMAAIEQRSVMRHLMPELSKQDGLPGGFDIGTQRTAWLGQLVTDWMGDHGDLVELHCRFGRILSVGDTPELGGIVEKTYRDGRRGLARLRLWVRNQRGETVSDASAVVALPTRAGAEKADWCRISLNS